VTAGTRDILGRERLAALLAGDARQSTGFAAFRLARKAVHTRVAQACDDVATGKPRRYGKVIVREGVIRPGGSTHR